MISLENQLKTFAISILAGLIAANHLSNLGFSYDLNLGPIYETALTKYPK